MSLSYTIGHRWDFGENQIQTNAPTQSMSTPNKSKKSLLETEIFLCVDQFSCEYQLSTRCQPHFRWSHAEYTWIIASQDWVHLIQLQSCKTSKQLASSTLCLIEPIFSLDKHKWMDGSKHAQCNDFLSATIYRWANQINIQKTFCLGYP